MRHHSRSTFIIGIAIMALGAIFAAFALAPLLPGGVPTGPLEFGGKGIQNINGLELLLGAIIIIIGLSVWKFGYKHKAIFSTTAVIAVFFLSVFATLSSLNSYLYFTGINLSIQYGTNDQGYFGPSSQELSIANRSNQNLTVDEISSFNISILLSESPSANSNDGIASIKATIPADAGFSGSQITSVQITSVSPPLPISFSPGSSVVIKLILIAPGYSAGQNCLPQYCPHGEYYGPIDLAITTTNG